MKGRIVLLSLLSTFLLLALVVPASATTRTVGVSIGNTFRYSVTVIWNATDPNATPSSDVVDFNNTEWGEVGVFGITGTQVFGQRTFHYKDGTENTTDGWVDLNTGANLILTESFISANLTEGDSVYTHPPYNTYIINDTVTRTYLGGVRDTNYFSMTYSSGTQSGHSDSYWDKSTGVLVETLQETTNQTGAYATTWSLHVQIISSNVWTVPEFPTWTPALLILIAVTSATIVIARQRQPKRPFR